MPTLPNFQVTLSNALQQPTLDAHKTLVIGHSSTFLTNTIRANATVLTDAQIGTTFGAKSQIANVLRAIRTVNKTSTVDALCVPTTVTPTSATYTLTIAFATGVTTLAIAQQVSVILGGTRTGQVDVSLVVGNTVANACTAIAAAINAVANFPWSATATATTVVCTPTAPGVMGNGQGVEFVNSEHVFGGWATSAGVGDLDMSGVVAAIGPRRYQTIIVGNTAAESTVRTLLNDRFNASGDPMDGVMVRYYSNATYNTILNTVTALNSASDTVLVDQLYTLPLAVATGTITGNPSFNYAIRPSVFEAPESYCGIVGGIRALRLTDESNISQFVAAATGARDVVGGPAIASLPYFNSPLPNVPPVPSALAFTGQQQSDLTAQGGTISVSNRNGTVLVLGDVRTTYKTTATGDTDDTFAPLNHVDTASQVREFFLRSAQSRFGQSRLTEGDVQPDRNMANKDIIETFLDGVYATLGGPNFVLTQAGDTAQSFFAKNRKVTLDMRRGKVTAVMQVPIVTQLRTIVMPIQIGFSVTG